MKRLPSLVAAGLLVLLGAAGCSSSAWQPQLQMSDRSVAEVTGFAYVAGPATGETSGPITVRVTGMKASRLALLVSQLPAVARLQVDCQEPLGLTYRIVFGAGLLAESKVVVEGYECDAAVTLTVAGKTSLWRRDASCKLIRAVRQVLPGRATATRSIAAECES